MKRMFSLVAMIATFCFAAQAQRQGFEYSLTPPRQNVTHKTAATYTHGAADSHSRPTSRRSAF